MNVVELHSSNFRDVVKTLRTIADSIEAGTYGDVKQVVVVTQGPTLDVFHLGAGDAETAHMLLACGMRKFEHAVLSAFGGYNFGGKDET